MAGALKKTNKKTKKVRFQATFTDAIVDVTLFCGRGRGCRPFLWKVGEGGEGGEGREGKGRDGKGRT